MNASGHKAVAHSGWTDKWLAPGILSHHAYRSSMRNHKRKCQIYPKYYKHTHSLGQCMQKSQIVSNCSTK